MRYTVFVMGPGGGTRFDLTKTTDAESAADLVRILVYAASGVSLEVGVDITQEGEQTPTPAAASSRAGRQVGGVTRQPQ